MPTAKQRRASRSGDVLLRHFPEQNTSIRKRILWQSLLLTCFTVMVLSLLSSVVALFLIRNRVLGQLSSTLASRENLLSRSLQYDRERTALLGAEEALVRSLQAPTPSLPLQELWERLLSEQVPVEGLTLLNLQGVVQDHRGEDVPLPTAIPTATQLRPVLDRHGKWMATDAYAPVRNPQGELLGTLAIRYNPQPLFTLLSDNPSIGTTVELLIIREVNGVASLVYAHSGEQARRSSGDVPVSTFVIPDAVKGKGGVFVGKDEWGEDILASYQSVPATGWGMVLKVDTSDALQGWERFVYTLLFIDLFLVFLTGVFGLVLAKQLSSPIMDLAQKMRALNPKRWTFKRSVQTGDEVELLDVVAAELTSRLRTAYTSLEQKVEERTKELHRQYLLDRTILEHIEYGVLVVNPHGTVINVNPAGQHVLRLTREEIVGNVAANLLHFFRKNEPLRDLAHPVVQALHQKKAVHFFHNDHLTLFVGKHILLPVALTVTPLMDGRTLEGILVILQDIREENQIDAMKSDFIALASHQLRTPLASLRWYLELMQEEKEPKLSDVQKSFVEQMEYASKRMVTLLDDLLRITHLEGGEIHADKRDFDLRKLMLDLENEWKPLARERGLLCTFTLPRRAVRLSNDPILLHLVLQNLFTNAMKYSPNGTDIKINLSLLKRTAIITVSDNGMGIPTEEQKHVFEKFFRAKNVKRTDADGSGLGLYLTRMIVENLDGKIEFKSKPGKGTTFTVRLPLK
ncbi:MAG: ATP-binding protein [Candidatus Peribacteraceae bacterium]|jgi:two-component system sensor histidine kinase VicK